MQIKAIILTVILILTLIVLIFKFLTNTMWNYDKNYNNVIDKDLLKNVRYIFCISVNLFFIFFVIL